MLRLPVLVSPVLVSPVLVSPVLVSAALALQLTAAAGALAGPWAIDGPAGPSVSATGPAGAGPAGAGPAGAGPAGAGPVGAGPAEADGGSADRRASAPTGPVLLSSPELWSGGVPVQPLGLDGDGALEVPATADALGWWSAGPLPGEQGAAVVVGHVDLDGRAGVFARLARARPGTQVVAARRGAPAVRYRVISVERYAKRRFPSDEVYGPSGDHQLRLITCGGRFDPKTGHYEDNVVVVAVRA